MFRLIHLLSVAHIYARLDSLPDELPSRVSLARCVSKASERYFEQKEVITVSLTTLAVNESKQKSTSTAEVVLAKLFSNSKWSLLLHQPDSTPPYEEFIKKSDAYMIIVRDETKIDLHVQKLKQYYSWNPHAEFIILAANEFENNKVAAAKIIIKLNSQKIYKGIVILPMSTDNMTYEVFTWDPFSAENCGDRIHRLRIIDRCKDGFFKTNIHWFANKVPNNLNNCKIKVTTVVWPPFVMAPVKKIEGTEDEYEIKEGVEIQILNTVAEVANFSIAYHVDEKEQNWGYIYYNNSCAGMFCLLKNEEVDVALSSLAATVERHEFFDYVSGHLLESLNFCVPHALREAQWKNVANVLKIEVGFICLILIIVMTLLMFSLSYFELKESTSYKNLPSTWQNLMSVLVGITIHTMPRSHPVRFLMLLWIFFGLHLNIAYQTNLVSVLTGPKYENQLGSAEELLQSDLKLYFLPNTVRYFKSADNTKLTNKIVCRWNDCDEIKKCLFEVAFARTAAMCAPMNYVKYASNRYTAKNGEPLLYCFNRHLVTYPIEIFMRKGFPLRDRIETIISRINAAGLPPMWMRNLYKNQMFTQGHEIESLGVEGHCPLALAHLQAVFLFYFVCLFGAFVIFCFELYYHKYAC